MVEKVDKTGMAVIVWQSAVTQIVGHGSPIPVEAALSNIEQANREFPDIVHIAVPAGKLDQALIEIAKAP